MRILHLFSDWKWTGPAEPALSLAAELARRGHEVRFACESPPHAVEDSVGQRASKLPVVPVEGLRLRKHFAPLSDLFDARACSRLIRETGTEIVHVHRAQDHLVGGLAARWAGTGAAVVRTNHTARPLSPWSPRNRLLLGRWTDRLIEISRGALESDRRAFDLPPERVRRIETPVDLMRFRPGAVRPLRAELGIAPDDVVVGIVARVQRKRRFELLFEAFRRALASHPRLRLLVVGRGTHFDSVAARPIAQLGIRDRVTLAGYRGEDYPGVLACFDLKVFLVPGTDGSCRAVREAMASGIPVVATRRGMLPEIVEEGTGLLVEEDPVALAEAILRLSQDAEGRRAMGERARAAAARRFDPARHADAVEALYEEALAARRGDRGDARPEGEKGRRGEGGSGSEHPTPNIQHPTNPQAPTSNESAESGRGGAGAEHPAQPDALTPTLSQGEREKVDVSVVLVNWNGRKLLEECLASIRDGSDGLATETVFVDNGSTDGSVEYVRDAWPGVKKVENAENRGFGAANNQAFRLARGGKVLLLNTDARLERGTLGALARFLDEHQDAAAVTPALASADGRPQNAFDSFPRLSTELLNKHLLRRLFPSRFPSKERAGSAPLEIESALGACLLLRRRALEEAGGFDEGYFFFLEETDLCLRLRRRGWGIWCLPSARAVHLGGGSKAQARPEAWIEYYRSLYRYFRKNRSRPAFIVLRLGRFAKLWANLAGSALLLAASLGRHGDSRKRLPVYARLLGWHLRLCPDSEGLRAAGRASGGPASGKET